MQFAKTIIYAKQYNGENCNNGKHDACAFNNGCKWWPTNFLKFRKHCFKSAWFSFVACFSNCHFDPNFLFNFDECATSLKAIYTTHKFCFNVSRNTKANCATLYNYSRQIKRQHTHYLVSLCIVCFLQVLQYFENSTRSGLFFLFLVKSWFRFLHSVHANVIATLMSLMHALLCAATIWWRDRQP